MIVVDNEKNQGKKEMLNLMKNLNILQLIINSSIGNSRLISLFQNKLGSLYKKILTL